MLCSWLWGVLCGFRRLRFQTLGRPALPQAANAGNHRTREDLHNRAASFRGRFRLHGDVAARATDRVMDPEGLGEGGTGQEEGCGND